jgi:hypothetical protein
MRVANELKKARKIDPANSSKAQSQPPRAGR